MHKRLYHANTLPVLTGVLTVCGHQYCKECIRLWFRAHRNCPVCKRQLHLIDLIDITFKDDLHAAEEEQPSASPAKSDPDSPHISTSIYSGMNATTLKEIKSIDLNGSYGTKIDTIARHLLWIREHDPGSKSLIFSQFGDFLQVLGGALRHYRIGYSSSNSSDKSGVERFKRDPSVEVFLLDAKSESSGLNLVSATHVFLCEPLLNTALELQAIGRVHRIGQQRPTTVYQYVIAESVEESIYELATSRRMAHMSSSGKASEQGSRSGTPGAGPQVQENILDSANTLEMQQAPLSALLVKGRSGGEVVESEDLWNCLFGKARRRPEKVSGEMAREVDRFLRAEAAESRGSQAISGGA